MQDEALLARTPGLEVTPESAPTLEHHFAKAMQRALGL
jgi:hypothetical protein